MAQFHRVLAIAISISGLAGSAMAGLCDTHRQHPAGSSAMPEGIYADPNATYVFVHAGYTGRTLYERIDGKIRVTFDVPASGVPQSPPPLVFPTYIRADGECYVPIDGIPDGLSLRGMLDNIASGDPTVSIKLTTDGDALRFDIRGGWQLHRIRDLVVDHARLLLREGDLVTDLGTILVSARRGGSAAQR